MRQAANDLLTVCWDKYCARIENAAQSAATDERLLWPNTPIGESIQERIAALVGVSDREARDPRSRPARIGGLLERLVATGRLNHEFGLLDVACGDGRILLELAARFPPARLYGLDCHAGRFPTHAFFHEAGIRLVNGYLQDLFVEVPTTPFDVVLMLNTFRDWVAARLRPEERSLPEQAESWILNATRFAILSVNRRQLARFHARTDCVIEVTGAGEGDSHLILVNTRIPPQTPNTEPPLVS